ncbi:MAG: TraR/DksA C4-type zinc finger protein, partial [Actinobacteria bacterium]|nr:TraR/DksA C4-type zinc finger protein [Actinomycetota bacterium]
VVVKAPTKKISARTIAKSPAKAPAKAVRRVAAAKAPAGRATSAPSRTTRPAPSRPVTPAPKPPSAVAPPVKAAPPVRTTPPPTAAPPRPIVSDWTAAELGAVRAELASALGELRAAYDASMRDLDDLQRSSTDGAGDDQADAGSKTFEREQEQSIAANRRDLITQIQHAVDRIDSGTYGYCESCGRPIPKARLKAFPAATLDVACKQREERR